MSQEEVNHILQSDTAGQFAHLFLQEYKRELEMYEQKVKYYKTIVQHLTYLVEKDAGI